MITVEHLRKDFPSRTALEDVSFTAHAGEVLGFLGPNGAGKTTTMRIITGYLPLTSGRVEVAGFDVTKQSLEVRRNIGYLPESVPLYPELSVREYLGFMAKVKGLKGKERAAELDHVMAATGVDDRADQIIGKLSKGYRQRVGLAQALLGDPKVLVLDEPTVGLDPKQIIEVRNLIKGMGGKRTVILSTHILPEVSMTCSRVVIINQGRIVAVDKPEALNARLRGSESIQVLVRGPRDEVVARLNKVPRVLTVEPQPDGAVDRQLYNVSCQLGSDVRESLAHAIVTSGWGLLELRPAGLSLEEIFLQLTTREEAVRQ